MRVVLSAIIILMLCLNIATFIQKIKLNKTSDLRVQIEVQNNLPIEEPSQPVPPKKGPAIPVFTEIPVFRSTGETGTIYNDVLSHCPTAPFGNSSGRSTNVHETAHGIHSYLRNKYTASLGKSVNGFYVLEGRAVIVEEPKIKKSQINEFVPQNLRSYRFETYLGGQKEWEDFPLYIYDEWTAYVLGGKCNIDDVKTGKHEGGWTDGVSASLGFSIYAISTSMAVQKYDPDYWKNNEQFRNFTIWMLRESYETFKAGRDMNEFKWKKQEELLIEFLTSPESESMREFLKENLDGVWLDIDMREGYGSEHDHEVLLMPSCGCDRSNLGHKVP